MQGAIFGGASALVAMMLLWAALRRGRFVPSFLLLIMQRRCPGNVISFAPPVAWTIPVEMDHDLATSSGRITVSPLPAQRSTLV